MPRSFLVPPSPVFRPPSFVFRKPPLGIQWGLLGTKDNGRGPPHPPLRGTFPQGKA